MFAITLLLARIAIALNLACLLNAAVLSACILVLIDFVLSAPPPFIESISNALGVDLFAATICGCCTASFAAV